MNKNRNIVLASNACWQIFNFRKNIIKKLLSFGYKVTVIAADDHCSENIESLIKRKSLIMRFQKTSCFPF